MYKKNGYYTFYKIFPYFAIIILLSGCTQKIKNINKTISFAVLGEADINKSPDYITELPYASIYARIGKNPQLFMVLAFAEKNHITNLLQLKWVSNDRGMLITEYGRLVKTINLPEGDLLEVNSDHPDPLSLGLHLDKTPKIWSRKIDWQPGYHIGYQLNSMFEFDTLQKININGTLTSSLKFIETVTVKEINYQYKNIFWIHPHSGIVIKSQQYVAPSLPLIEITILKPFL